MRIYISEKGRRGFMIPLPFWMIRLGVSGTVIRTATRNVPPQHRKYIEAIDFRALSHCISDLKNYKGLHLVHVVSKDGDEVKIVI